jgi:hypothetical protein
MGLRARTGLVADPVLRQARAGVLITDDPSGISTYFRGGCGLRLWSSLDRALFLSPDGRRPANVRPPRHDVGPRAGERHSTSVPPRDHDGHAEAARPSQNRVTGTGPPGLRARVASEEQARRVRQPWRLQRGRLERGRRAPRFWHAVRREGATRGVETLTLLLIATVLFM